MEFWTLPCLDLAKLGPGEVVLIELEPTPLRPTRIMGPFPRRPVGLRDFRISPPPKVHPIGPTPSDLWSFCWLDTGWVAYPLLPNLGGARVLSMQRWAIRAERVPDVAGRVRMPRARLHRDLGRYTTRVLPSTNSSVLRAPARLVTFSH